MALAPGPIMLEDPRRFRLTAENPGLEALWLEHDQSFAGASSALDRLASGLSGGAGDGWAAELAGGELAIAGGLADEQRSIDTAPADPDPTAIADIDELLNDAYAAAPPETWEPLPDDFVPPAHLPEAPTQPGVPPPGPGGSPLTPPGGGPGPAVSLHNDTRGGSTVFYVGDTFTLMISGEPNAMIWVSGYHDQQWVERAFVGYVDQSGWFVLSDVIGAVNRGWYSVTYTVGDQVAQPSLTYTVY